jgi:PIN domain nuclease of toxin-antitoxin system
MNLMLDTHTLIWFMEGNMLLPPKVREMIMATGNKRFVGVVSFYEMAIKINLGKLTLTKPLGDFFSDTLSNHIEILPISQAHLSRFVELPIFETHKDPFDRLIIATAIEENATFQSADNNFRLYENEVNVVWKE